MDGKVDKERNYDWRRQIDMEMVPESGAADRILATLWLDEYIIPNTYRMALFAFKWRKFTIQLFKLFNTFPTKIGNTRGFARTFSQKMYLKGNSLND